MANGFSIAHVHPRSPSFEHSVRRKPPGSWLRAIDFGCAQQVEDGVTLTRKTGTPMFMVRCFAPPHSIAAHCLNL